MKPQKIFTKKSTLIKTLAPSACLASVFLTHCANAFTVLPKPPTVSSTPETGRSVAHYGAYTLLSAEGESADENSLVVDGERNGAIYLYQEGNATPIRTYQFFETEATSINRPAPYDYFGFLDFGSRVAMGEHWLGATWMQPTSGGNTPAIVVIGKESGSWKSCSNSNCVDNSSDASDIVYDPAVHILTHDALANVAGSTQNMELSISGNTIAVSRYSSFGDGTVVVFSNQNGQWLDAKLPHINNGEETFGRSVAIDGSRIVVGAPDHDGGTGRIYVYELQNALWQRTIAYTPVSATSSTGFGRSVDISGNDIIVGSDQGGVMFLELNADAGPGSIVRSCTDLDVTLDPTTFGSLAIDNGKAVVARSSNEIAVTYEKTGDWRRHGGVGSGLFPNQNTGAFWSVDLHSNTLAWGWRNYANLPTDSKLEGAAVTSNFDSLACGMPNTQPVQAFASSVENAGLNANNATDGDLNTRWSSEFSDPQWLTVDLGELRLIGKVVLHWEAAHSVQYTLQVSNDNVNWTTFFTQASGQGGIESIEALDFDNAEAAFGRYVRMYSTQRGTPWGNSLWEMEVYAADHSLCPAIELNCAGVSYTPEDIAQAQGSWEGHNPAPSGSTAVTYNLIVHDISQYTEIRFATEHQASAMLYHHDTQTAIFSNESDPWGPQTNPSINKVLAPGNYSLTLRTEVVNPTGLYDLEVSSPDAGTFTLN